MGGSTSPQQHTKHMADYAEMLGNGDLSCADAVMGEFFDMIDVDGSGAIDENEIVAMMMVMCAAAAETEGDEENPTMAGVVGFLGCIPQLSEHMGDADKCDRATWDSFEPKPFSEDMDAETFQGIMVCFLVVVIGCLTEKESLQASLKEIIAAEDFEAQKEEFMKQLE